MTQFLTPASSSVPDWMRNAANIVNDVAGRTQYTRGGYDCSSNPNYPRALKGEEYLVTVAGKIGGASGTTVNVGDRFQAIAANDGGTQAAVGSSWKVITANFAGSSGSQTLISRVVTSGSQASVTFSGISGSYEDLVIRFMARSLAASTEGSLTIQFNGDTGANYDATWSALYQGSVTGVSAFAANSAQLGGISGNTAPTGCAASGTIIIPAYARTVFHKAAYCSSSEPKANAAGSFAFVTWSAGGRWRSTSAITSITLTALNGFVDGSVITLFGIS